MVILNESKRYKVVRIIIQTTVTVLLLLGVVIACVKLYPIFVRIQNDEVYRNEIVSQIQSTGIWGGLILILIQVLQTVLAVIPSGPVVIIAGMMYPSWIAVLICLFGQTLGALLVIGLVKLFGYTFISLFVDIKKVKQLKLLSSSSVGDSPIGLITIIGLLSSDKPSTVIV